MRWRGLAEEPLHKLVGEAAWRGIRSMRQLNFHRAGQVSACPVRFHPIGYYQHLDCAQSRKAILAYADAILRGEYPLLGYGSPHLGVNPDWHTDWVSGKSWPLEPSGKLVVVRRDGSDVKAPWELSRLQFAPVVAQAHKLTNDGKYRAAVKNLLTDWVMCNPVGMGVNWTIAMEAALRGISLCLCMELLWPFTGEERPWVHQMTASLWQHLRFIEAHNEFSFLLRSNHYLSNIVGLTTLSAYLGLERRREKYARAVQREILLQTYPDGGDREGSTGYHVLVAQLGLHSLLVQQRCGGSIAPKFEARLQLMFAWVAALADDTGKLPHLGDCDNGRVELLLDDIAQAKSPAERHSLRVGSLFKQASSVLQLPRGGDRQDAKLLPDSGIAVLHSGHASVIFSAMPNGLGGKGSHTHCDKLSIVFRLGGDEVFCDSGSRCYTRSTELRNFDRSTAAHNTLLVDESDQNTLGGELFRSGNEALVSPVTLLEDGRTGARASHQGYSRFNIGHKRTVELGPCSLQLVDEVSGADKHLLELRFILGPEWLAYPEIMTGERVTCRVKGPRQLTLQCEAAHSLALSVIPAQISREYGAVLVTHCIRIQTTAALPAKVQTRVQWD
jgi:Heparinase II/III-like protein/Heparinase II/III N-terminus